MAYDEMLAARVRAVLKQRGTQAAEKRMFGGLAFMARGHMACGIVRDELMLRVGPIRYDEVLEDEFVRPMDFTGRPMRGMVFVAQKGLADEDALSRYVDLALSFVDTLPDR